MVKNRIIIVILSSFFLFSCSSAPRFFVEEEAQELKESVGTASFYAEEFQGKKTADGEIYDMNELTCAHPSLPFNSLLKITNLNNKKTAIVRVNDRMPPRGDGRIIDLSKKTAQDLDFISKGLATVRIEILRIGLATK